VSAAEEKEYTEVAYMPFGSRHPSGAQSLEGP